MTGDDVDFAVGNAVEILKASKDSKDRIDAYLIIEDHLSTLVKESSPVGALVEDAFVRIVKDDCLSDIDALSRAAFGSLKSFLSEEKIVLSLKDETLQEVMKGILSILTANKSTTHTTRCFECFALQSLPSSATKDLLPTILKHFQTISDGCNFSDCVVYSGLSTIQRFCALHPDAMVDHLEAWFMPVLTETTSDNTMNHQLALTILQSNSELFRARSADVAKWVDSDLKERATKLTKFFDHKKEIHAFQVSCVLLKLLGKVFAKNGKETCNLLFAPVQKVLRLHPNAEVLEAFCSLWRAYIDVLATDDTLLWNMTKRRLLRPILFPQADESSAIVLLKTGWYLICNLAGKAIERFDEVVTPVLQIAFPSCFSKQGDQTPGISNPLYGTLGKKSKGSWKSIKLIGANIIRELFASEDSHTPTHGGNQWIIEKFPECKIPSGVVLSYWDRILACLVDATEVCNFDGESIVLPAWISFLSHVLTLDTVEVSKKEILKIWAGVVTAFESLIEQKCGSSHMILELLIAVPDAILAASTDSLKQPCNTTGSFALHIIQMLLSENVASSKGVRHDSFFIVYERCVSSFMTSSHADQLMMTEEVLKMMESLAVHLSQNQPAVFKLWTTLCLLLEGRINHSQDVNQGNGASHNFAALVSALTYPIKSIDIAYLSDEGTKELVRTWKELYKSFNTAVTLIAGLDSNQDCEEVCKSILLALTHGKDWKNSKCISVLLNIMTAVVQCLQSTSDKPLFDAPITPTKLARKFAQPLSNYKSLVDLTRIIVNCLVQATKENKHVMDEETYTCIDLVTSCLGKLKTAALIVEGSKTLLKPFCDLLGDVSWQKVDDKLRARLEKLIIDVFEIFQASVGISFDSHLLTDIEFILIACLTSKQKQIRITAVKFWNTNFSACKNLEYSSSLETALKNVKCNVAVVFPGSARNRRYSPFRPDTEETAQFPDFSLRSSPRTSRKVNQSPVKVHGSFMEKDASPLRKSPFKPSPAKPFKSPFSATKPVRRKLPVGFEDDSVDYVTIESPVKSKRLLTEHQKDKRRERSTVPVLYNNLDLSQDTSLFQSLGDSSSQGGSQSLLSNKLQETKNPDITKYETDDPITMDTVSEIEATNTIDGDDNRRTLCEDTPTKPSPSSDSVGGDTVTSKSIAATPEGDQSHCNDQAKPSVIVIEDTLEFEATSNSVNEATIVIESEGSVDTKPDRGLTEARATSTTENCILTRKGEVVLKDLSAASRDPVQNLSNIQCAEAVETDAAIEADDPVSTIPCSSICSPDFIPSSQTQEDPYQTPLNVSLLTQKKQDTIGETPKCSVSSPVALKDILDTVAMQCPISIVADETDACVEDVTSDKTACSAEEMDIADSLAASDATVDGYKAEVSSSNSDPSPSSGRRKSSRPKKNVTMKSNRGRRRINSRKMGINACSLCERGQSSTCTEGGDKFPSSREKHFKRDQAEIRNLHAAEQDGNKTRKAVLKEGIDVKRALSTQGQAEEKTIMTRSSGKRKRQTTLTPFSISSKRKRSDYETRMTKLKDASEAKVALRSKRNVTGARVSDKNMDVFDFPESQPEIAKESPVSKRTRKNSTAADAIKVGKQSLISDKLKQNATLNGNPSISKTSKELQGNVGHSITLANDVDDLEDLGVSPVADTSLTSDDENLTLAEIKCSVVEDARSKIDSSVHEPSISSLKTSTEAARTFGKAKVVLKDNVDPMGRSVINEATDALEVRGLSMPKVTSDEAKENISTNIPSSVVAHEKSLQKVVTLVASSTWSPSQLPRKYVHSAAASPVNSILKKSSRLDSPSPPSKGRRVSFHLPEGHVPSLEERKSATTNAEVEKEDSSKTNPKANTDSLKVVENEKKAAQGAAPTPVFPELVSCTEPIEHILPSLSFARTIGNVVRANNIFTVGDLSALSEMQIETLPVHSPKVPTVRSALKTFQMSKAKVLAKSSRVGTPYPKKRANSGLDSTTPPKEESSPIPDENLVVTPSRHSSIFTKQTLHFDDGDVETTSTLCKEEDRNLAEPIVIDQNQKPTEGNCDTTNIRTNTDVEVIKSEVKDENSVHSSNKPCPGSSVTLNSSTETNSKSACNGDKQDLNTPSNQQDIKENSNSTSNSALLSEFRGLLDRTNFSVLSPEDLFKLQDYAAELRDKVTAGLKSCYLPSTKSQQS